MSKKSFFGSSKEESEARDEQASPNADGNEKVADSQRADDLARQSPAIQALITEGSQTTTTPDSQRGEQDVQAKPVGELDTQSPEERMKLLRGWAKRVKLGGPRQADWEKFQSLVGDDDADQSEPGVTVRSGEDRKP